MHHTGVLWWMDSGGRLVVDVLAKGLVWLLLMLAAERFCGRKCAAWRSLLWRIGCVGLIWVPLSLAVPVRLPIPLKLAQERRVVTESGRGCGVEEPSAVQPSAAGGIAKSLLARSAAPSSAEPHAGQRAGTSSVSSPWWPLLGVAGYLLGVCAMLSRLGLALGFVAGLSRSFSEVKDPRWIGTLQVLKAHLGIDRPVKLATSDKIDIPVQVGVFRPAIVLPGRVLGRGDRETRESVLAHELAHLLRRDYLFNLVAGIAMALHWPNPACWLAVRRLRDASEETCDDWAVRLTGEPASYAGRLLELAVQARGRWVAAAVGMHTSMSRIGKRIARIEMLGGRVWPLVPRVAALVVTLVLASCAVLLGVSSCEKREGPRPSTGLFAKPEPRSRKPELAEEPVEPRVTATRQTLAGAKVSIKPEAVVTPIQAQKVVPSLAQAQARVARTERAVAFRLESEELAKEIAGKKAPPEEDMATELLDIMAMDVGKHHAMVMWDPADRHEVKGYCRLYWLHIPRVHDRLLRPEFRDEEVTWRDKLLAAPLRGFAQAMNEYTAIRTEVGGPITIGDLATQRIPWVYYTSPFPYELSDGELGLLGRHLAEGGFMLIGWSGGVLGIGRSSPAPFARDDRALRFHRENLVGALETQGIRADFQILGDDHAVYHSYFDFSRYPSGWDGTPSYLEGLEVGGRVVAILSKTRYSYARAPGDERESQFRVNLIVFALTQDGSLAQRFIEGGM